ncbi:phage holin family protein [Devosia sp. RR2S18]|jgi:uncharacterized membrane protein YqjE|uniref:phage holin family protein n=1 Tax=Devosia rhizosphaerae TaxID=3049774 RepID=UPI0025416AF4|nr:phage holin family protein [Devosia sp. RR2S18]WIJ24798.1 phage holin family protein [Devosia sp. RR2S18]
MATTDSRSLGELLGGLATDISNLFRTEIQLAKTEASEKASQAVSGLVFMGIGAVLAVGAIGVLLSAIVALGTSILVDQGFDVPIATSISAGIVTIVVALIAWMLVSKGIDAIKKTNLNMSRTTSSLSRDADMVKEKL